MEKQVNKEQMLENTLKEFSAQGELINGLGDALTHITLAGSFNEQGEWQEPEWKNEVLRNIAQARELIQKLYFSGLDSCEGFSYSEIRSRAAQENVDRLYRSDFKKELAAMIDDARCSSEFSGKIADEIGDRILECAKIEIEKNREPSI